ncbi:S41 family peptidase [Rhodothermus profundi]|uniref:C-terminal processing peptidase-3. Serine peptidase. MEROPS family S41A n=1 Tax=Rhodothermus profundi TaxID=633813 RepID=A0A1M6U023_9BACT|nr:S41 family peptidase [Rhodothermus profundi]SHK62547.1 C-terminal processing peptidase-3. Serine peptidase. MEROPS family S41A [Rhodothermus profundi]
MKAPQRHLMPFLLVLLLGIGIGLVAPRSDTFFALQKHFRIFGALYETLVTDYIDPIDPGRLMRKGIDAMLAELDPYTTFFDEADRSEIELLTRGRYGGVGLNVGIRNGRLTVLAPIEGAAGYRQGIRTGDIITHIDGQPTDGLSLETVRQLLRGQPGTTVTLTIEREGEPLPLQFVLTREEVQLKNVTYVGFLDDDTTEGLGYIRLERFTLGAGEEVRRAIEQLKAAGSLRGLVLDLRNNPGGLLEAAVEVTGLFVPQGAPIVSTRGRTPDRTRIYRNASAPLYPDLPLVILVNELSASASEIVAGAIQDLDRGLIVGTNTYGKGLVQIIRPLPYNTALKLTTAAYYTPSGRSIQAIDYSRHDGRGRQVPDSLRRIFYTRRGRVVRDGHGIEPDVVVAPPTPGPLETALRRQAAFFFFANHYVAQHPEPPTPDVQVDDQILEEFRAWLEAQQFDYQIAAEHTLATLQTQLETAHYTQALEALETVHTALMQAKKMAFEREAEALRRLIRQELLARYLPPEVHTRYLLADDPVVQRAAALLRDAQTYAALLSPN